jgi:hypothetical protein
MKRSITTILLVTFCVYFFSWLVVYKLKINSLPIQSEDTVPALFLPLAIIKNHTLYLDEYYPMMLDRYPNPDDRTRELGMNPFYVREVGEHVVSAFPIITPLIALPIYYFAVLGNVNFDWNALSILAHLTGALIMSLSAAAFWVLLNRGLKIDTKKSNIVTFIYAFCTINFAHISQGMWQHGTVQLFTILALIFFLRFYETKKYSDIYYYALFMGIAILSRPTAGLPFLILSSYLVLNKDFIKRSLYIGLGLVLPVLFFVWYNATYYVSISNQGYANQLLKNWLGDFPISFIGVWLSPSKGILIYSPVLLFGLLGAHLAYKNLSTKNRSFYRLCLLIVFLHTLVISFWKHWFGGWSFGYRMTSDVLPFLVLPIACWLEQPRSKNLMRTFFITLYFSLFVQLAGIVFFDGIWHAAYDRGFKDPRWLWSVKDSEFAFNARRTLVKLGYLDKACPTCAK